MRKTFFFHWLSHRLFARWSWPIISVMEEQHNYILTCPEISSLYLVNTAKDQRISSSSKYASVHVRARLKHTKVSGAFCSQRQGGLYHLVPQCGLCHFAEECPWRARGGERGRRRHASDAAVYSARAGSLLPGALRRADASEAQSVLARAVMVPRIWEFSTPHMFFICFSPWNGHLFTISFSDNKPIE